MNYLNYFAKGGKTESKGNNIIKGIQKILGVDDAKMAELWQIGLDKYGSEEGIAEAINQATQGISQQSSSEEVKTAIASVFSDGMFKCGGKLQYLVSRFGKGGSVDCGCGGTKLQNGGEFERAAGYYRRHADADTIRKIQNYLYARGYDLGPAGIDGKFGRKTFEAIRALQRSKGLKDDGMWGEDTNREFHLLNAMPTTTYRGPRSGAHATTNDFVRRYDDDGGRTPTPTEVSKVVETAIINPEWFWGDTDDAKRWRVYLEKDSTPGGKEILQQIWRETPSNIQSKIGYNKLPTSLQSRVYNRGIADAINEGAEGVLGTAGAIGIALNPIAGAGALAGGYFGGNVGEKIGADMAQPVYDKNGRLIGYRNASDYLATDLTGDKAPLVRPDKSTEGRAIGTALGTVLGGAATDYVGSNVEFAFDPNYNPTGIEFKSSPIFKEIKPKHPRTIFRRGNHNAKPPIRRPDGTYSKTPAAGEYVVTTPGRYYVSNVPIGSRENGGILKNQIGGRLITPPHLT